MNFYPFHIGDYAGHTRGLSLLEDLAYRRCLDAYYQAEGPLTGDVPRLIGMREHAEAVAYVLSTFFTETPEGWRNKRCDEEIAAFKRMKEGGAKGAAKRWAKGGDSHPMPTPCPPHSHPKQNACPPQSEANANQEPLTINQKEQDQKPSAGKPPRKSKRDLAAEFSLPDFVDRALWVKWIAVRNRPDAGLPENIAKLAGWRQQGIDPNRVLLEAIAGGWQGLYLPKDIAHENRTSTGGKLSAVESVQAAIARRAANTAVDFIDGEYIDADFTRDDRTVVASHG